MTRARCRPVKCSAVISDVDDTLVTDEKVLTERTRAAAALRASGILFSLISSRPPRGLRMLIAPLGITAPIVCFNGGMQRRSYRRVHLYRLPGTAQELRSE
jgi:hydroxymethylpyrimidine pyrophosphatase-like HAD family hydrolase